MNFGRSLTIGVEEELMLLDAESFALAPGVERLLGPEGLKTELFSCLVETNTPVCESAVEALAELQRLRGVVVEAAAREGLVVAGAATHPFSLPEEQEIVQEPRYLEMLAELGEKTRRQLVCGLHVHIGMESFEAALRTLNAVVPWLPPVLALSLNSPYLGGAETGVLSTRAGRLLELPRGGRPPLLE
ncbi:MAG: carboxylate-amine ligase [Gaiellaceae bacterium]